MKPVFYNDLGQPVFDANQPEGPKVDAKTKAKRQSCLGCGKKNGKIEFHLLVGADKVLPYHAECLKKQQDEDL